MAITRRQVLWGAGAAAVVAGGAMVVVPVVRRPGHMEPSVPRAASVDGTSSDLPAQADVVVVGAGIMGVATAFYLAEKGLSVVVCEKGVIAGEQSSRAYGQATNWGQKVDVVPMGQRSMQLWNGMNAQLGADTSYRAYGRVQAFDNDEDIENARKWFQEAQAAAPQGAPLEGRFVEGAELAQLLPGATSRWKMGLYIPQDGGMEPALAAPAVARGALARGVRIVTQCAVRGLETSGGAVSAVVTEKGVIKTSRVVVAGGTWSRLLLGNADVQFPVLPVYLSQQRLSAVDGPPAVGAANMVVWRKEVSGTYSNGPRYMTAPITRDSFVLLPNFASSLVGMLASETPLDFTLGPDFYRSFQVQRRWALDTQSPFETRRTMAPVHNDGTLDDCLGWIREEFPVFQQSRPVERWAGTIDVAHDQVPVVSAVPQVSGLFVMGGFTFGLTQGLGAGELMADLVTGAPTKFDPTPYSLQRLL